MNYYQRNFGGRPIESGECSLLMSQRSFESQRQSQLNVRFSQTSEDDYIYIGKLIHHPCVRCRDSHFSMLQSIPKMVGEYPVVDRTKRFVWNGTKRQKLDCTIGLMGMDAVRNSRTDTVTVLASTECWDTVHVYGTRGRDRGTRISGMDIHMFVCVLLTVRQGGPFDAVCIVRGNCQRVG